MTIQPIKRNEKRMLSMELSKPRLEKLNIIEDWFSKPSTKKATTDVAKLGLTKASQPVLKETPDERMARIIAIALKHKVIRDLCEKAYATPTINESGDIEAGAWDIGFEDDETASAFGAYCVPVERRIAILSKGSDDSAIHRLVFELTNAVHAPRSQGLISKAKRGDIGCEEYTKEMEHIEYEGMKIYKATMYKVGYKHEDLSSLDGFEDDFEDYWLRIKDEPHSNHYRRDWRMNAPTK